MNKPSQVDITANSFPTWVIRKIGQPILTEADWNLGSFPNTKYGALLDGTSTLARETTNLLWGGAGSLKMLTDATSGHTAEVKTTIQSIVKQGDYLAFEQKWTQAFGFSGTAFRMGLESRDATNILQAQFQYKISTGKWQYEDNNLTYQDFPSNVGGALPITKPTISSTVGNIVGWSRCVIDPFNKLYVGFEAGGQNGIIETRDMRTMNLPLSANGSSGGNPLYLIFVLLNAGGNGAEAGYTTDWCVSRIPTGVDPF